MKVTDVRVDGFGVWSGLELENLSPNCTVFYGANEAGKTTVLQFLRAALYGFSPERRARYLPPVRSNLAGGALTAVDRTSGRLRIVRREHATDSLGTVAIEAADGTTQSNVELRRLLHEVDENTFNHLFAVGLREMQELGMLTDIDAAQWLYSLTTGLDRVSLAEVLRELDSSRERIIAADGARTEVSRLLDEQNRLQTELRQLASLPQDHAQLVAETQRLDESIATAQRELTAHEAQHRICEAATIVYESCQRRRALDTQIVGLTPPEAWPAGSLLRMNRLLESLRLQRRQLKKIAARRKQLSVESAEIQVNESLCRLAPRIAALAEHEAWILSLEQELGEAQSAVSQWAGEQQSQQNRLKTTAAEAVASSAQIDDRGWTMLRALGDSLAKARRRAKAAHQARTQQRGDADSVQKKLEASLVSRGHKDLTGAIEAAGNRVTQLRRRVQVEDRIEQLTGAKADLNTEIARLRQQQAMPAWMVWGLGALFVVGVVMFLGGWFFSSWGWTTIILGGLAMGVSASLKFFRDQSIATQLDEAQNQLNLAELQLDEDTVEQAQLDGALPKQPGSWSTQLVAAEKELSQLEQLLPLASQHKSAAQSLGSADELADQAKRVWRKSLRRWKAALASQGLPTDLTPPQVREMSLAGNQLRGVERRLKDARSDLDRHRRELSGLASQVEQVFLAAGITPVGEKVSQRLKQLRGDLAEQENRRQKREGVARLRYKLRRKQAAIRRRIERLNRRRRLLLRDCEVLDLATFRRRAEETSKLATLTAERETANREIAALLAGVTTEDVVELLIAGKSLAEVEADLAASATRLAELRDLHRQLCQRSGQLAEQLRLLAADRRTAVKRFELNNIEQQLAAAVERWQTLTLTREVLLSVKEDYERNRQPETLREASEYLSELTRGHYRRVWTRFGENVLLVDDAEGRQLPVERLSRGTREQLFLSLRMALVGLLARRGIELPMILDDVLVNFDVDRAAAAVRVLRKFGERGHQLLIFTCHEHIARMFKRKGVDVRRLPDNAVGGRALPFEVDDLPTRKLKPRRIKDALPPPPEPVPEPILEILPVLEIAPEPEPEPVSEPVEISAFNIVTAESAPSYENYVVTAEAPAGQVEVRLVEPPEPLSEIEAHLELTPPPPRKPLRTARRRVDAPHRPSHWAAIRRGWNAEEFAGELDDQINPSWLAATEVAEAESEPPEAATPPASRANPPMRIIHPRFGPRAFKLLTDDDNDAPEIVELSDDAFEADDKLA